MTKAPDGSPRAPRRTTAQTEGLVLVRVSWVMLAIGLVAAVLFALEPDVRLHPGRFLLACTGIIGTGMLRLLAFLLRTPPRGFDDDDTSV